MKDEWRYQDDNLSTNGHLVSGKSEGLDFIDIDDLEMVLAHPEYFWLCLYVVPENNVKICHYSAWKTKQEALIFAMQMPGCGKHHVINRFTLKIV